MNSMTGPIDTLPQNAASAQALLGPYAIRSQNPYTTNYNFILPQLGISQPTVVPQYCNTAAIPSAGLYDQAAYLNNYLCFPPTNGYIAPANVPTVQPVNDAEGPNDAYGSSKIAMGIFDPPPAKALNLATTIATTTMAHIPKRDQVDIPVPPITFENQIPLGLQVHFANSPHVEEISTVNAARSSIVPVHEAKQDLQSRYKNVIESEPMYYQKSPNY